MACCLKANNSRVHLKKLKKQEKIKPKASGKIKIIKIKAEIDEIKNPLIKNNFADLFSSLTDFQIQLLSEKKKSEMHYVLMNG